MKLLKYIACFGAILLQLNASAQYPISLKSFRVNGVFNDTLVSVGTGFIIKSKSKHYLITNLHLVKHVLSFQFNGFWKMIDDTTKKHLPPAKLLSIRYYDSLNANPQKIELPLLDKNGNPLYTSIFYDNNEADVIAVPFSKLPTSLMPRCVDYKDIGIMEKGLGPSSFIYIIGFPQGWEEPLPIWKSSSTAVDDYYRTIYINPPGYIGMSGSPVWVWHENQYYFVGVYSAEYRPGGIGPGLGLVWKSKDLKAEFEKLE